MSLRIGTPVNQRRLTNVSVVRLTRNKKRYEIACYNNKVLSWRQGVETDLGEVLQSEFVFFNVGKGEFAKAKDMKAAFGSDDPMEVAKIILEEGELQVSGKERGRESEAMFRDVATIVAEKCVNPGTGRPYTTSTILSAMKDDLHWSGNATRSPKQQALEVMKRLPAVLPLARAPMHVRVHLSSDVGSGNATRSPKQQALEVIKRLPAVLPLARAPMHVRVHLSSDVDQVGRDKGNGATLPPPPPLAAEEASEAAAAAAAAPAAPAAPAPAGTAGAAALGVSGVGSALAALSVVDRSVVGNGGGGAKAAVIS
eukprot:CAMPEP_0171994686 /NCGR_PEP_ID=MMETSP0993-20121228/279082_1 /TAXON_ID=483369 /ORGANISM="non described non described, Strain CCMP2098" /LENGTH=311 /DNA_ID=CAMNT_0012647767 /DNA_START=42 /DNA_END=973 /DNA_ORIENTATION=-